MFTDTTMIVAAEVRKEIEELHKLKVRGAATVLRRWKELVRTQSKTFNLVELGVVGVSEAADMILEAC